MNDQQIAETILNQLGGNKFIAMTGAKQFLVLANGLRMNLPGNMTANKANRFKIELTCMDTYNLTFYTQRKKRNSFDYVVTNEKKIENVYCDQLVSIFEKETQMATSL